MTQRPSSTWFLFGLTLAQSGCYCNEPAPELESLRPGASTIVSGTPGNDLTAASDPTKPVTPQPKRKLATFAQQVGLSEKATEPAWQVLETLRPISEVLAHHARRHTDAQVELGRMLFFEPRLSKSQHISCSSCHDLQRYGVDGRTTAIGHAAQEGPRNTPTVLNSGGFSLLFWDGRAASLEHQAREPLFNPLEMALEDEQHAIGVLRSIPEYGAAFERAFPTDEPALSFENLLSAIGAYERRLITPAPWDRFVAGDDSAVSVDAKRGFVLFQNHGCVQCHTGELVGSGSMWTLGTKEPWPNQDAQGRYEHSQRPLDKMRFRVPSLRNVAMTAPYFHDGSVPTLESAVNMMLRYQLGKVVEPADVSSIVAYLGTLTGELPEELVQTPELPMASASTPPPSQR